MVLKTEDVRERTTTTTEIPTKTEYRIIVENCTIRLSERVNELLNDGWELQGGVSGHTERVQVEGISLELLILKCGRKR
jgi:hypothetical protein